MRSLAIVVAIFVFAALAGAVDRVPRRAAPSTTIQSEEPDSGEEDEGAAPELRDDDDGFDDGREVPSEPAHHPRSLPGTPGEEEEEPPPPPEASPSHPGPAEPASAMQPASPH